MRVLVVGQGGREHALCLKIAKSPLCEELFCAPGNAGINEVAKCIPIASENTAGLLDFCRHSAIDFVVIGPEGPLVAGLADLLESDGFPAFGPSKMAARLEGSKGFTKEFCVAQNIPTAAFRRFTDAAEARSYIRSQGTPIVIKADGLAAGKGVTVARNYEEASAAVEAALIGNKFGEAGREIVIEECLTGREFSFFAFLDGSSVLPLTTAQDYKRVGDGDIGPNTGGMGSISPAPGLPEHIEQAMMSNVIRPTVEGMKAIGSPYKGILYAGMILTEDGPKLIEYNVRFGDPECQALLIRMNNDLLPILIATREGRLSDIELSWNKNSSICIVLAAEGYPGKPKKGSIISGLAEASAGDPDVQILHAATKFDGNNIIADGGRVLNVVTHAPTLDQARAKAYAVIDKINWPQGFFRRDIGVQ
jgi:phosphoribosylamine---glycine ligase